VRKVVFMGMGEPAHNLDNVLEAIDLLGTLGGIGHKSLVFSTVGDARVFERLPTQRVKPALALSLHTTRADLREEIGMVLQDTWLFGGTIRENIAYGRPDASEEEIVEAAKAAYVDRFVRALPDGYDTLIDEEGSNVSTGERQLITIARAFLAKPSLLILDEATSSVDTRTEVLIQKAMANLRADRTSFVIAHRLSTIRDADLILVMEQGRIVEQGTHDELLERQGAYYDLYQAQFVGAIDDDDAVPVGAGPVGAGPVGAVPVGAGPSRPGAGNAGSRSTGPRT
jgi:ABC-type phosphate transport system ATPase subunit